MKDKFLKRFAITVLGASISALPWPVSGIETGDGTNQTANLNATNSITLRGDTITNWPSGGGGGTGDVSTWSYYPAVSNVSLASKELTNVTAMTLGGERRTNWPSAGAESPVGTILMFGAAASPSGWLLCDKSAVSRVTYTNLWMVIGTNFGAGDGSTTFNVPDLRGRHPLGLGDGPGLTARTIGQTNGTETVTLTTNQMPAHTHGMAQIDLSTKFTGGLAASGPGTAVTTASAGNDQAHSNMPPFQVVNFIIKY